MRYKLVFIGSTGGGVLSRLAAHPFVRNCTHEVASDRPCGFLDVARRFELPAIMLPASDGGAFANALLDRYGHDDDIVFLSSYTRLLKGPFVHQSHGRIFNCHPSILPSFKGMNGFEDTLASSSLFMGCTLHQVDEGIDTGSSVIQAAMQVDRRLPMAKNRHKVFLAQYYAALQFIKWIDEERLHINADGSVSVESLRFDPGVFSPSLDQDFFEVTGMASEMPC